MSQTLSEFLAAREKIEAAILEEDFELVVALIDARDEWMRAYIAKTPPEELGPLVAELQGELAWSNHWHRQFAHKANTVRQEINTLRQRGQRASDYQAVHASSS